MKRVMNFIFHQLVKLIKQDKSFHMPPVHCWPLTCLGYRPKCHLEHHLWAMSWLNNHQMSSEIKTFEILDCPSRA